MKNILIAAADAEVLRTVSQALPDGYRFSCADTMPKAISDAKKSHHDLIFIDIEMLLEGFGAQRGCRSLQCVQNPLRRVPGGRPG